MLASDAERFPRYESVHASLQRLVERCAQQEPEDLELVREAIDGVETLLTRLRAGGASRPAAYARLFDLSLAARLELRDLWIDLVGGHVPAQRNAVRRTVLVEISPIEVALRDALGLPRQRPLAVASDPTHASAAVEFGAPMDPAAEPRAPREEPPRSEPAGSDLPTRRDDA